MRIGTRTAAVLVALVLGNFPSFALLKTGDRFVPFSLKNVDNKDYTVMMEGGRLTLVVSETVDGQVKVAKSHPSAVLIDFWATWCVPCRASMPHMQKLHEQYGPAAGQAEGGLRLFGIAIDERGSKVVVPFYQKLKITYPMLADPPSGEAGAGLIRSAREMKSAYKVQTIPVVYIIDARGTITHVHEGFKPEHVAELQTAVQGLVGGGKT